MTGALVTTEWLAGHLNDDRVKIVDASYYIAGGVAKARELYGESHIPGALFFDIDAFADPTKQKIHAFPPASAFAEQAGALGLTNADHIIAYDGMFGTCAAARAWFMFRAFGHAKVSVLDGGFSKWVTEGRPVTKEIRSPKHSTFNVHALPLPVLGQDDVLGNIASGHFQMLDARAAGRFEGSEPEPRAGLRAGHIPGSLNLPFMELIDSQTHVWKEPPALKQAFAEAGVDLSHPLATTCGSGVSACALAFGAYLAGKDDTVIYDGSWVEWGANSSLPVVSGPVTAKPHPS